MRSYQQLVTKLAYVAAAFLISLSVTSTDAFAQVDGGGGTYREQGSDHPNTTQPGPNTIEGEDGSTDPQIYDPSTSIGAGDPQSTDSIELDPGGPAGGTGGIPSGAGGTGIGEPDRLFDGSPSGGPTASSIQSVSQMKMVFQGIAANLIAVGLLIFAASLYGLIDVEEDRLKTSKGHIFGIAAFALASPFLFLFLWTIFGRSSAATLEAGSLLYLASIIAFCAVCGCLLAIFRITIETSQRSSEIGRTATFGIPIVASLTSIAASALVIYVQTLNLSNFE